MNWYFCIHEYINKQELQVKINRFNIDIFGSVIFFVSYVANVFIFLINGKL